jgi:hypothetical protein
MGEFDRDVATELGMSLWYLPLDEASTQPQTRQYLIKHHVDDDGLVDIPIYILRRDAEYVASVSGQMDKEALKLALSSF